MTARLAHVAWTVVTLGVSFGACTSILGDDFEIDNGTTSGGGSTSQGGGGMGASGGMGGSGGTVQPGCGDGEHQTGELCLGEGVVLGQGFTAVQLEVGRSTTTSTGIWSRWTRPGAFVRISAPPADRCRRRRPTTAASTAPPPGSCWAISMATVHRHRARRGGHAHRSGRG